MQKTQTAPRLRRRPLLFPRVVASSKVPISTRRWPPLTRCYSLVEAKADWARLHRGYQIANHKIPGTLEGVLYIDDVVEAPQALTMTLILAKRRLTRTINRKMILEVLNQLLGHRPLWGHRLQRQIMTRAAT